MIFRVFILSILLLASPEYMSAQNRPCERDGTNLQFVGLPIEQARCLLRPNLVGGNLGAELKKLPPPLEKLIGRPTVISKVQLRKYLNKHNISEDVLGGSLDKPLSTVNLPGGDKTTAFYFIIHDTSSPYLKDEPFPENFNTDRSWKGNDLTIWLKNPVAHIFVNRLGESITTTPFEEAVRKGWGTKFSRDYHKAGAKGFQIHIELIQPRRRDPAGKNPENDLIAPVPGFTGGQYERLALLYISASVRRGSWLIPAYHSAIDAGIKDAHDDPQNFDLNKFAQALGRLKNQMD